MKLHILCFVLLLAITAMPAAILRVNNHLPALAPYTTIQDAIDAANGGDTLIVEGSETRYSHFTVDKQLSILGPGYFLPSRGVQHDEQPAVIQYSYRYPEARVCFVYGSSGSVLSGFNLVHWTDVNAYNGPAFEISANDVIIENCLFTKDNTNGYVKVMSGVSTCTIRRCWDLRFMNDSTQIIEMNIYDNKITYLDNSLGAELTLFNNVITAENISVQNTYAYNNIFTEDDFHIDPAYDMGNVFQYNICANDALDPNLNNLTNVAMYTLFTQDADDAYYQLQPGCVAEGAGMNGDDIGMFGGTTPYVLSGVPWQLPTIYGFNVTETGSNPTMINVEIQARNHPSVPSSRQETNEPSAQND